MATTIGHGSAINAMATASAKERLTRSTEPNWCMAGDLQKNERILESKHMKVPTPSSTRH